MKSEKSSRRSEQNLIDWQMKRASYSSALKNGSAFGTTLSNAAKSIGSGLGGNGSLDGYGNSPAAQTARNTKKIADSVSSSEQDIALLTDIASRDAINRFTTASINIDMKQANTITKEADVDGVVDALGKKLAQKLASSANGVYA